MINRSNESEKCKSFSQLCRLHANDTLKYQRNRVSSWIFQFFFIRPFERQYEMVWRDFYNRRIRLPMHFIRCMQSSYFVIYSIFVLQAFRFSFAVIVRCSAREKCQRESHAYCTCSMLACGSTKINKHWFTKTRTNLKMKERVRPFFFSGLKVKCAFCAVSISIDERSWFTCLCLMPASLIPRDRFSYEWRSDKTKNLYGKIDFLCHQPVMGFTIFDCFSLPLWNP